MWYPQTRLPSSCLLFALAVSWLVCAIGCAEFEVISRAQPLVVRPERPQIQQIGQQDLNPLTPDVRSRLLDNIRAWKLYIRQFEETMDLYNDGVRERNAEMRRRLQE